MSGPRILLTGATGFIGGHVARRLVARGCELHAISRRGPYGCRDGLRWWGCDLTDVQRLQDVVAEISPERIIHLAASVSGDRSLDRVLPMLEDTLVASVSLLVAATRAGCRRVVLAGSLEEPRAEENTAVPVSPYAAAKWALGGYARMFFALYGLPVVTLRIGMAYGPGQLDSSKLVPYVLRSTLSGEVPVLGSGTRRVDWVYVDDVADGIERACFGAKVDGETLDLGSGRRVSVREMVERLVSIANPAIAPRFGALPDRPLEGEWSADVVRSEALLGWRPRTTLDEGIARTVEWFRSQRAARQST